MLSIASLQIEPNLRVEHAVDWALRKRWIGIDSEGRAMLAAAVLANGGRTAAPFDLGRLAADDRGRGVLDPVHAPAYESSID